MPIPWCWHLLRTHTNICSMLQSFRSYVFIQEKNADTWVEPCATVHSRSLCNCPVPPDKFSGLGVCVCVCFTRECRYSWWSEALYSPGAGIGDKCKQSEIYTGSQTHWAIPLALIILVSQGSWVFSLELRVESVWGELTSSWSEFSCWSLTVVFLISGSSLPVRYSVSCVDFSHIVSDLYASILYF